MSKEHLAIALALSVPVVVCITKVGRPASTQPAVPDTAYTSLLDRHDAAKRPRKDRRAGVQDSAQPRVQVRPLELGTYAMCELIAPRRKTPVFVKSMECAVAVAQAFGKERCAMGSDC